MPVWQHWPLTSMPAASSRRCEKRVHIAQKTVKDSPEDKLIDILLTLLCGAQSLVQINTLLRSWFHASGVGWLTNSNYVIPSLAIVGTWQGLGFNMVILLAAPLSFVGAMVLLLITGTPLNVSSFMGLILLVGLIVKNGIILLDFTRHRMKTDGLTLEHAISEAGRVRLRPILMTTLCTLFGLLPLALGLGAGSELQKPLALAVIGGLALSTPITLYVVPTLVVAVRGRDYSLNRSRPR